jgi:Zn-finger nucleic acid-binding protein
MICPECGAEHACARVYEIDYHECESCGAIFDSWSRILGRTSK